MWQSLGFPCSLVPAARLSRTPGILTMLPQHVNATPPTCGTRPVRRALPQSALHQEGILINLLLSLPLHPSPCVYYIESTAWKSDTFPAVVSVNQESASGQVNRSTLVMWAVFKFGMCSCILVTVEQPIRRYMLMHPPMPTPSVTYSSTHHLTAEEMNHLFWLLLPR